MRLHRNTLARYRAIAAMKGPFSATQLAEACDHNRYSVVCSLEKWCKLYGYLTVVQPASGFSKKATPNYYGRTAKFDAMMVEIEAKLAGPVQPKPPKLSVVEANYRAFREPIDTRTPEWISYRDGDSHQMKEAA